MKNRKTTLAITWILAFLPLLLGLLLYRRLPAQIPTHWNLDGQVTYSPKAVYWLLALISPAFHALLLLLPKLDPRRKNYARFQPYYGGFLLVLMAFLLVCDGIVLSESLHPGRISVGPVIAALVGLLFLLLGNWLPKFKSNFFVGIRTPWTLSDPDIWNRSNRLAGQLFFVWGLILLAAAWFLPETLLFWILIVGTIVLCVLPTVASYRWFREKYPHGKE